MIKIIYGLIVPACIACTSMSCTDEPSQLFEHVVVIGIDGLTSDGLKQAHTPAMDGLIANGAYKYNVRTILPSISSPNWSAMIHGAGPEATGVTSNDKNRWMHPVDGSRGGRFPGIFDIIREQIPGAEQGSVFHWRGFGDLVPEGVVDLRAHFSTPEETTAQFCDYITTKKPAFAFIQLDHVDGAGHGHGYASPEYLQTVENADALVGRIVEGIRLAGIGDKTLTIVVSDHGGIGTGHGGQSPQEVDVPIIFYGNGIRKGYEIDQTVYMYDLAASAAFALGLKAPYVWTGRPALPAFEGYAEP